MAILIQNLLSPVSQQYQTDVSAVLCPSLFVYNVMNTVLSVFNIYLLLEQWQNLNIVEYV